MSKLPETKSGFGESVQEKWDAIRFGEELVYVTEDGVEVPQDDPDAEWVLHPSYRMLSLPSSLTGITSKEYVPVDCTRAEVWDAKYVRTTLDSTGDIVREPVDTAEEAGIYFGIDHEGDE